MTDSYFFLYYLNNGFITGCLFSLIFLMYESYLLSFILGLWTGFMLSSNYFLNKSNIKDSIIQFQLWEVKAKRIQLFWKRYYKKDRYKIYLSRIIFLQSIFRKWLVTVYTKQFVPRYLEWSISCKWKILSEPLELNKRRSDQKDIIRLDRRKYNIFNHLDIDLDKSQSIWMVPNHQINPKLLRYSVIITKHDFILKYYSHKNPEDIHKIQKGDYLISYYYENNKLNINKISKVVEKAQHPLLPSISL